MMEITRNEHKTREKTHQRRLMIEVECRDMTRLTSRSGNVENQITPISRVNSSLFFEFQIPDSLKRDESFNNREKITRR